MNRHDISKLIIERLNEIGINYLKKKYEQSGKINHLIIEKVLPNEIATKLSEYFPEEEELNHLVGPQENKYVGIYFTNKQKLVDEIYRGVFLDKKKISKYPRFISLRKIYNPKIKEIEDTGKILEVIKLFT